MAGGERPSENKDTELAGSDASFGTVLLLLVLGMRLIPPQLTRAGLLQ
jgi:hypothetical protein